VLTGTSTMIDFSTDSIFFPFSYLPWLCFPEISYAGDTRPIRSNDERLLPLKQLSG